jgi:serine/threonine-protein kinase
VSLRGTSSAPPPGSAAPAPVSDWEEDDDKTSVFSRESGFDAAHLLMGRLPDAAPPPMSRPSAPIPTAPVVAMPSARPPLRVETSPASVPPVAPNRSLLVWGAAAAAVLATALIFLLRPTTGGLVVTVAGPASRPLDKVEVLLDGKAVCKSSPCTLKDLAAGTHMVRARAEGYLETAETAVLVTGGQDAVHNIRLAPDAGTGVRVTSQSPGLRLFVDDKDMGPLPQELKDLSPGVHTLRVSGEQFETWEKQVTVNEGQVLDVELPKLKVVKGLAVIKAGENADDAKVVLDSGGDRRALPSLPMSLHIDTSKTNTLTASKRGYESFEAELVFEPGVAEKTFEINLPESESPAAAAAPRPYTRRPARSTESSETAETGSGTLNINSIPASNILLDGRPVGTTPKVGLSVSAGKHTVVFVADGKRASKSVKVAAGQSVTVAHRFK